MPIHRSLVALLLACLAVACEKAAAPSPEAGASVGERRVLWAGDDAIWDEFGREAMEIAKGHMSI